MTGIRDKSPDCESLGVFSYSDCTDDQDIPGLLKDFAACSGGMTFNIQKEEHCTANQIRVVKTMRPYTSIIKCASTGIFSTDCLDYYNTFRIATDEFIEVDCTLYFDDFLYNAIPEAPACATNAFAAACTDFIGDIGKSLYNTEVFSGIVIDTTSTKCTSTQWNAIADFEKSYIPFVLCAMRGTSPVFVLDCIEADALLENVLASAPCASCFKQLAIEAYIARILDTLVEVLCVDPYSAGCISALAKPLAIFKECSGFNAMIISNGECSASARAELETRNAGLAQVIALVGNSVTATQAVFQYSQISDALNAAQFPCMYCHVDLIVSMFNLSVADRDVCVADLTSWDCYVAMGSSLDNFYRCSRGVVSTTVTSEAR